MRCAEADPTGLFGAPKATNVASQGQLDTAIPVSNIVNSEPPTSAKAAGMSTQGCILDIVIECSSKDGNHLGLKGIQMLIKGSNNEERNRGSLKRTSQSAWSYGNVIGLNPDMSELTFVVRSEDSDDIGSLSLSKGEIDQYVRAASSTGMRDVEHKFVTKAEFPVLLLRFAISGARQDQEPPVSPPLVEGNAFRLDEMATVLEALEEEGILPKIGEDMGYSEEEILNLLGNALRDRFEQTGDLDDISKAIEYQQRAVALTHQDHVDLPSRLTDLGTSFLGRFERMGTLDDLSKAIEHQQHAIALIAEDDDHLSPWLNNLGTLFMTRFKRMGDLNDISEAIEYQKRAVALTPDGHADAPAWLNNLGTLFMTRFERTGDLNDISKAIEYRQRAVALIPEDHKDLPLKLSDLSKLINSHFERTGDLNVISKAIEYQQRAVALTPDDHANMSSLLTNLSTFFTRRFERTGSLDDISKAIEYLQHAIFLTPEGHAVLPGLRTNIGRLLTLRFQHTSTLVDCEAAIHNFRLAAFQPSGPPSVRFDAARRWAHLSIGLEDLAQALRAYTVAVELFSLVAASDQTIQNRDENLIRISDFTPEAVAVAIRAECSGTALEWFEQGRCLVWGQIDQLRTPVDQLRAHNAPLIDHFLTVSNALELSESRSQLSTAAKSEDHARTHLKLAQEWTQILDQIRHIPGFHDFLQPRNAAAMLSQSPLEGPIIIINVHTQRCDALALIHGADEVLHIPLDDLTYQLAEELRQRLRNYLENAPLKGEDRPGWPSRDPLRYVLRMLWKSTVKPILDALGYHSMSPHRSRIWWCPSGPLSFLPIHAAGLYGREATSPGMCLSDYVVSSYIPSVNTLLEKLRHTANANQSDTKILLISQSNTPGHPPLPCTTTETQAVLNRMTTNGVTALRLEGEEATTRRVKEELKSHSWVHFSCHAFQNPGNPLKSAICLHDGRPELTDLIRQKIPAAEFAFLSACETSAGDEMLSDEVVHLAAGMLAAGYQGVVGTMWFIGDAYAPKIAEEFYEHLLKERRDSGSRRLNSSGAAYALDHAVQQVRNSLPDDQLSLLAWVPYAHYGL